MKQTVALIALVLLMSLCGPAVRGEVEDDGFQELEAKITKSLASERWHDASKVFLKAVWSDYKAAHTNNQQDPSRKSIVGDLSDVKTYDEYLGQYARKAGPQGRHLIVEKTARGLFIVKLEGHTIPAVATNGSILFTTGDVVYSRLPQLGEKPYADLEMLTIVRLKGTHYLQAPGAAPRDRDELIKLKE